MSLHLPLDHQCAHCEAYYIPYDAAVVCPQCGANEETVYPGFINHAVESANFNLQHGGSYIPEAWFVGSFGDHILKLTFSILEAARFSDSDEPFETLARTWIDKIDFQDQEYLREHLLDIVKAVHQRLKSAG